MSSKRTSKNLISRIVHLFCLYFNPLLYSMFSVIYFLVYSFK